MQGYYFRKEYDLQGCYYLLLIFGIPNLANIIAEKDCRETRQAFAVTVSMFDNNDDAVSRCDEGPTTGSSIDGGPCNRSKF